MTNWVDDLAGDDWQEYCGSLLRYRYEPVNVQAVPAVQGDLGIDYWIRGSGDIYQCYGTEFGDSVKERLRLQKEKLGDEGRTLSRCADRIAAMIAPAKCRRYILLVPRYDSKELLEYAARKTAEIRAAKLAFCASDFEIAVQSLEDFGAERLKMQRAGLAVPRLMQGDLDGQTVHDWLTDNGELARTMREKIEAMHMSRTPEQIDSLVNEEVANYLTSEDALTTLQLRYPDLYERTRRVITTRRRRLRAIGGRTGAVPRDTLVTELDSLAKALSEPPVGIDDGDAMVLSTGTVAKWLADCTLDPR
jgi:hypothetical protein